MTTVNDERLRAFLAAEAQRAVAAAPSLDEAISRLAPRVEGHPGASRRLFVLIAATLLLVAALGTAIAVGSGILRLPLVIEDPEVEPMSDLGIFAPVAGRIVYGDADGIWGLDPTAPTDASSRIQLSSETGTPLGWSSDGRRLLIVQQSGGLQAPGRLVVLHADGSETQVADQPMAINGATISPDGSRVVFATGSALYAVDALGGPAELIVDGNGRVEEPSFSPDGMRIAYVDGSGDNSHHVMVIDADGSNAQEIGFMDCACHVYGLAWSPAGDKIAIALEGIISTFGIDGSDLTEIAGADTTCGPSDPCAVKFPRSADAPYWSPDGSRIAFTTGCVEGTAHPGRDGCHLAITDADGSNMLEFSYGGSGPWHPGTLENDGGRTSVSPPSASRTQSVESMAAPSASPGSTAPPLSGEVTDLVNRFLQARIAGAGAEQYVYIPDDVVVGDVEDIPLLYATSSGAPYERAEVEPLVGIDWPYGFAAFKVRLFAGDTVVEQLFFTPHDLELFPDPARIAEAHLKLEYVPDGFGTDIPPTTEDGQAVGVPYSAFDGELTVRVAHPWVFQYDGGPIRLTPEDAAPTTDGGERNSWEVLTLLADPVGTGPDCPVRTRQADAAALAESIRSGPDLEASAPLAVGSGGTEGLMMDVVRADGATSRVCGLSGETEPGVTGQVFFTGNPVRLYLFDSPAGSSMRILAIAIAVPESRFERAVEAPLSVDFDVP